MTMIDNSYLGKENNVEGKIEFLKNLTLEPLSTLFWPLQSIFGNALSFKICSVPHCHLHHYSSLLITIVLNSAL